MDKDKIKERIKELADLMRKCKKDEKFKPLMDMVKIAQKDTDRALHKLLLKGGEDTLVKAKVLAGMVEFFNNFLNTPDMLIRTERDMQVEELKTKKRTKE